MNKSTFLNHTDVAGFIDWLCPKISTIDLDLNIASSRFVPGGISLQCKGIEPLCNNYQWNAKWTDSTGISVISSDWKSTQFSLSALSQWLKNELKVKNTTGLLQATLATLEWGGVNSARPFLENLAATGRLVDYFDQMQKAMELKSACLARLNPGPVLRFDSGLTKIHALLSDDGLPIYDSRVAAAIAALVYLYSQEKGVTIGRHSLLRFPVTKARGNQIRNLSDLPNGKVFPWLYSNASHSDWAQTQVKLGWIMTEVLNRMLGLFASEASPLDRMHAFEASFFMMGYDLRCVLDLWTPRIVGAAAPLAIDPVNEYTNLPKSVGLILWDQPFTGGRVPTVHNFETVIDLYNEFRQSHPSNNSINDFINWLVDNGKINTRGTANAYCYPLKDHELSISLCLDSEVDMLATAPTGSFSKTFLKGWRHTNVDELPNCIADVYIVGITADMSVAKRKDYINDKGFAGTDNAVNNLLSVGRSMGRHFGFLDPHNKPTDYFNYYFS